MRRKHAVVEDEVDPRPRGQRGELLEQLQRLEHEMARAVRPGGLERERNAAIGQEAEPVLSHRRPEQIAAELFQARAIGGRHRDVGVEIEAREMRAPGGGREHPRRVGIVPHAPHPGAGARTESDSPLNRGAADARQSRGFFDHRVQLRRIGVARIQAAALEQTLHPCGDPRKHDAHLFIRRRRQGPEPERVPIAFGEEDGVEEQRVEMDVQVQSAAEPLDDRHGSRTTVADPVSAPTVAVEAEEHTYAPSTARATALAGERHEPLERAVGAPEAREAVRQHPAGQEVSELLFHELRQG
jgi:hypothetical protein